MQQFIVVIMSLIFVSVTYASTKPAIVSATNRAPVVMSQASVEKTNINKADLKALQQLTGMNHYKAQALLSYRKAHGDFTALTELKNVPGFKRMAEEKFNALIAQMTLS